MAAIGVPKCPGFENRGHGPLPQCTTPPRCNGETVWERPMAAMGPAPQPMLSRTKPQFTTFQNASTYLGRALR